MRWSACRRYANEKPLHNVVGVFRLRGLVDDVRTGVMKNATDFESAALNR